PAAGVLREGPGPLAGDERLGGVRHLRQPPAQGPPSPTPQDRVLKQPLNDGQSRLYPVPHRDITSSPALTPPRRGRPANSRAKAASTRSPVRWITSGGKKLSTMIIIIRLNEDSPMLRPMPVCSNTEPHTITQRVALCQTR